MAVSTADIRGLYTKMLVDVYQERIQPTDFLQTLFPLDVVPTKEFAIEVERMGEKVAIDVVRGTEGNRNTFSRSTEKIFEPPYFREYFDLTELALYDRVMGSEGNANTPLFTQLLNDGANRLNELVNKIKRAKEIQCAQVLTTGIVTFKYGITAQIDFKRKAASIVDLGAGNYFANNVDPFAVLEKGCIFIRQVGRSGDGVFNALCGSQALTDLLKNTQLTTRQNLFNMALDQVIAPERMPQGAGATYHGTLTCGSFKVQLWAYPQFYDLDNGDGTYTSTAYLDPKQIILVPAKPRFKMVHCAVPQLIGRPGQMPVQGEYVMQEFFDERRAKHIMDVQSAPCPVPVAVDTIYNVKVVA